MSNEHPLSLPIFGQISEIVDRMGVRASVVGGYVRDYYLRRPSTDIDVVVVGSGIEVAKALGKVLHSKVSVRPVLWVRGLSDVQVYREY